MSLDVLEEAFAEYNISDSPLGFKGRNTTIVKSVNLQTITLPLSSSTSKISDGFFDSVFHSMSVQIFQRHKYQNRLILELRHENLKKG